MTTEELIARCEAAVVPVERWSNRDSAGAQRQIGEALVLLRAGAEWREAIDPKSDERTLWIEITYPGFEAFECGRDDRTYWADDLFYIPTAARVAASEGSDWY
jgi:hypothetical protein